ncbi:phage tail protein [Floricoccus penangensis]|uniref:phage tail protein n=1 Tax=Floricoccus penangensis TaxID=1859475 RepID=UPI00203F1AB3|nr:hypothetical protein [Floricoccus penangensis]URZ87556.1 hypothetical protein KIW23_00460 [Floricoccus penangensis]
MFNEKINIDVQVNNQVILELTKSLEDTKKAVAEVKEEAKQTNENSVKWLDNIVQKLNIMKGASSAFGFLKKGALEALGANEEISNSFKGLTSTIEGGIKDLGSYAVSEVISTVDKVVKEATGSSISEHIDSIKGKASEAFTIIKQVVSDTMPIVQMIAETFFKLLNFLEPYAPIILGIAAAFLSFTTILGIVETLTNTVGAAKEGFALFNMVLKENPFILIASLVIGIVSALIYLWNTNEDFRNFIIEAWENIKDIFISAKDTFVSLWNGIGEWFSSVWNGLVEIVSSVIESIKQVWNTILEWFGQLWTSIQETASLAWTAFTEIIGNIINPFIEILMGFWTGLSESLSLIWQGISAIASGAWEILKNVILGYVLMIIDVITGDFSSMGSHLSQIWENIKNAASLMWEGLKSVIEGIVNAISSTIMMIFETLSTFVSSCWEGMCSVGTTIWNTLKDTVLSIVSSLVSSIQEFLQNLSNIVQGIMSSIGSWISSTWSSISSTVSSIVNGMASAISGAMNGIQEGVQSAINTVKRIFTSLQDVDLFDIGKNIIQGLINGIKGMIGSVVNSVQNIAGSIKDSITGALGIHSPSRWMRDFVGKFIPEGIAVGIEKNAESATSSMDELSRNLMRTIDPQSLLGNTNMAMLSSLINTPSTSKQVSTVNNSPEINVYPTWNGKADIIQTMEEIAWQTTIDERGGLV